jgi:hypothetical protein
VVQHRVYVFVHVQRTESSKTSERDSAVRCRNLVQYETFNLAIGTRRSALEVTRSLPGALAVFLGDSENSHGIYHIQSNNCFLSINESTRQTG